MKKLVLFAFALTLMFSAHAQIETPQPSPFSKIEQKVGLTDVTLEYSRPSMRGREVFGNLVPFGKIWRTGANKNTMITFSDDVIIDGQSLKAGSYAIFVTPSEKSWDVVFYSDTQNWGTPGEWDNAKVAAKTTVEIATMPTKVETFTIVLGNLTNSSAELGLIWETAYAGITFEVPTDVTVTASIEKTMAGPSANDYYAAAVYNLKEGKDLNKAKEWMDTAMSMVEEPAFWQLRQQSLLYAKMGDKKSAIATAKKSLEKSKEAKNNDYVKMNQDSLEEWGAM
jgi:hypothetical protein